MRTTMLWLQATRPRFFTGTFVPILLGTVVAWSRTGVLHWALFLLALLGGVLIHAGLDLANDYYDQRGDRINTAFSPFNGGSRFIQDGVFRPRQILAASIVCFLLGSAIGLFLNALIPGNRILLLGIAGVFLAFFYSAPPFAIGHTGFGELAVGLGFGPLMVLGAYCVQAGAFSWQALLAAVPVGIMISLVLYINEFPDHDADRAVQKRTLVVILGKRKAVRFYGGLLALAYAWVAVCVGLGAFPPAALLVLLSLPLAGKAAKTAAANYDRVEELRPANAATVALHSVVGLLLIAGYVLSRFF